MQEILLYLTQQEGVEEDLKQLIKIVMLYSLLRVEPKCEIAQQVYEELVKDYDLKDAAEGQ